LSQFNIGTCYTVEHRSLDEQNLALYENNESACYEIYKIYHMNMLLTCARIIHCWWLIFASDIARFLRALHSVCLAWWIHLWSRAFHMCLPVWRVGEGIGVATSGAECPMHVIS